MKNSDKIVKDNETKILSFVVSDGSGISMELVSLSTRRCWYWPCTLYLLLTSFLQKCHLFWAMQEPQHQTKARTKYCCIFQSVFCWNENPYLSFIWVFIWAWCFFVNFCCAFNFFPYNLQEYKSKVIIVHPNIWYIMSIL